MITISSVTIRATQIDRPNFFFVKHIYELAYEICIRVENLKTEPQVLGNWHVGICRQFAELSKNFFFQSEENAKIYTTK